MFSRGVLLFICFFCIGNLWAQSAPPSNLSGSNLRDWLKTNWYNSYHTSLGYYGVNGARSYMYNIIDNQNDSVVCVYSNYKEYRLYDETRAAGTTDMIPINCEHTIPQSFFSSADPMHSDIHHLFPTYENWNSTRSNKAFGDINDNLTEKWMYLENSQSNIPSSNIDLFSESSVGIFEPQENHKGNVARAIFYFYTMYPTQAGDISLIGDLYTLYTWHILDPVDAAEVTRNEAIGNYQGNRNPFILYPDRVKDAWDITHQAPSISLSATNDQLQISWEDAAIETAYQIYRSTDNITFSLQNTLAADTDNYIELNALADTNYYYYLAAIFPDGDIAHSDTINGQLLGTGNFASDLFISEYIEGSSFNKAIEIANFTGSPVDLSNYALGKQSNGSGSWNNLALSGILNDQSVYLVTNDNTTDIDLRAVTNLFSSSSTINFNGNDPIALINTSGPTDVFIDMIGTEDGGASYFASELTLVRKPNIKSPNANYASTEWTVLGQDNFSNAGQHSFGLLLPVELVAFTATAQEKSNSINWTIKSAINHHYFQLERSANAVDFEVLTIIEHKETMPLLQDYHYEDQAPLQQSYYRLKQVDWDGKTNVFPIKLVQRPVAQISLVVFPNPAKEQLRLNIKVLKKEAVQILIYNQNGQLVLQQNNVLEKGEHQINLSLGDFLKGMYILKLQHAQDQIVTRFVKID